MLKAFAAIVKTEAAIPTTFTGVMDAAAQTKPTAAIPTNSLVASLIFNVVNVGRGDGEH